MTVTSDTPTTTIELTGDGFYWVRSDDTESLGVVLEITGNDNCEFFRLTESEVKRVLDLIYPDTYSWYNIAKMLVHSIDGAVQLP